MSFSETYIPQNFSFPNSLIYYISHENVEALKSLLLTCKFFYLKYKIIPCVLYYYIGKEKREKWEKIHCHNFDNITFRLWLYKGTLCLYPSKISQILYRCEIQTLVIYGRVNKFNDLKQIFSSKKLQNFTSLSSTFIYSDGSIVPMENIFEAVPFVNNFLFSPPSKNSEANFTSESAQNLAKMKRLVKIKYFGIYNIPENFNLQAIQQFLKNNISDSSAVDIRFHTSIVENVRDNLIAKFRSSFKEFAKTLKSQKNIKLKFLITVSDN